MCTLTLFVCKSATAQHHNSSRERHDIPTTNTPLKYHTREAPSSRATDQLIDHLTQPNTTMHPLLPHLTTLLSLLYAHLLLTYPPPPHKRFLAFLPLCALVGYAFTHMNDFSPWWTVNDTFGRFLYIWLAHVGGLVLGGGGGEEAVPLAPSPSLPPTPASPSPPPPLTLSRHRQAWKVLFARHPEQWSNNPPARARNPPHHLSRPRFCAFHTAKALLFLGAGYAWDYFTTPLATSALSSFEPAHTSFVRRVPASLNALEVWTRLLMVWDVCVGDMLYFDSLYSGFAVVFVGVLRFDGAEEWDRSLFGGLEDCWSVRRYWAVYWHDFVRGSFSAAAKGVCRGWVGLERGWGTRVGENAMVFVVSGLMHSIVRAVQTEGRGEVWTVAAWYSAQMLPIVVEGVVQELWSRAVVRSWLEQKIGREMVVRMERAVGYAWVFVWMFWSVPKYLHTRHAWETANLRKKYPELFDRSDER